MSIQTIHLPPIQYKHNTSQLVFFFMYLFIYSRKIIPLRNYTLLFATFFIFYFHTTSLMLCTKPSNNLLLFVCEFVCVMTARKKNNRERENYKNKWIDWKIMWKFIIMWNIYTPTSLCLLFTMGKKIQQKKKQMILLITSFNK